MIKVCQKCMRVKLDDSAPWSPRPAPQVENLPKNKVELVEECDYCDGTIQANPGKVGTPVLIEVPEKVDIKAKGKDKGNTDRNTDVKEGASKGDPKGKETPKERREVLKVSKEAPKEEQRSLPDEKLATIADKHHQALVQCKKLMGRALIEFCIHLREIREKDLFRFYADSWYEYLSMPEIGLDDTRARRLIRLINVKDAMEKQLGTKVNFDEIAEARLTRDLIPCIQYDEEKGEVKNIKVAETLLDQARSLGHEDWQAEVEKKKPRVAGKKATEVMIEAPCMITNAAGTPIGQVVSVKANDENHYLKIRIGNENISDRPLIIKIP